MRVRRQLFLLHFARGELEAALEVGRLAVGSADLVLQAVDRAGSRPPDIVDEAVWAVLDQVPAVVATGDRALAAWLLDRAQQWSVPGPAERPRRVHGRVVHDRAAFLWGQMRAPAPADRALAEQHVRRVFETAAMAVGIRRELRDPSDPATVRDLASSLLQAAEITTAVMMDPASGVEALSLAAAELQALPDGQLAVDVLMETPDLRNTDIPPRMEAPDLPDRAVLLARALEDIVPQVVARQRRAGPWPRLKP